MTINGRELLNKLKMYSTGNLKNKKKTTNLDLTLIHHENINFIISFSYQIKVYTFNTSMYIDINFYLIIKINLIN